MGSARCGAGNSGLFPRLFDYPVFEFVSKKKKINKYLYEINEVIIYWFSLAVK